MKTLMTKALSAAGLVVTLVLAACGNNQCPSGQTMYNGVCTYTNGAYGNQCGMNQLMTQYGCLQTNVNGCMQSNNMAYSPQTGNCVQGTISNGYNTGYNGYNNGYNGYNNGYNNNYPYNNYPYNNGMYPQNGFQNTGCQNNFVYTYAYGCLPQNGCPAGTGMGPFGCTR